ncbi:ABC transporter substrate-binding protein [Jejudonia soesokkakensis]|uniref:ABC transporter substrate-binding protein n=1 Tax=Jejudonia soesokkakensis TaxID=1323432 RepID=A0ABW2MXM2_9FLAO
MTKKIAVLLPRSDMFPRLALDFLNGLKLSLQQKVAQDEIEFIIESIGTATDASVLKTTEKLLLQNHIDLTIGFCGSNILPEFTTLFKNYKKPLIHVGLGASVLKDENVNPYVLHHTLNVWQSAYTAASFAVRKFGKKVAILSSAYDGGYHISASFVEGLTAEGGEVVGYFVNPMDYKQMNFSERISEIEKVEPDVILAAFSYKEGGTMFKALSKSSLNGNVPILTIPLMTDESFNTENYNIQLVQSFATWSFADETEEMQYFNSEYYTSYDEQPTVISLLGFEVGLTILKVLEDEEKIPRNLSEALKNKKIKTPRGQIQYDEMNQAIAPNMLLRDFKYENSKYVNKVSKKVEFSIPKEVIHKFKTLPDPGWHNPYICT